jgi:hypothetical protein
MIAGRKLLILEGVHAGAELFLAEGLYMVGADLGCEVVLLDIGVDKQHLRLSVSGNHVNIERLGDAQVMLHGRAIEGKSFILLDGDVVRLGGAAFSVASIASQPLETAMAQDEGEKDAAAAEIGPEEGRLPRRRLARVLVPLLALLVLVAVGGSFRVPGWGDAVAGLSPAPPAAERRRDGVAQAAAPAHAAAHADADLVPRVREFIVDDALDVRLDGAGRIVVSGTSKKGLVREQIQRIAKEYAGTIEIVDEVSYMLDERKQSKFPLPQRITNVSVGRTSWFQTADGAKNFVGSKLADGAEVVRIDMDSVVFKRDGRLTVFRLNDREVE